MKASLARLAAIVRVDFLIRFRRASTLVVFLLLSAFAYVWIPDPATGWTLIQINGHRAIYNSGAVGMGTASLGMIFVGLFGFYVISNAIRRDVVSRCGLVVAATPMRSGEYLLGKFVGNVVFLSTFLAGYMLTSMAMLIVRGEAPIEPLVFLQQYFLLCPAAVVFVSVAAVLFESIRFLSGKLGDVLYFFFWMAAIGLVVSDAASKGGISWARYFDFTGFGFMIDQMMRTLHTTSVAIGAAPFDPHKATIVFPGLTLTRAWVAPRLVSTFAPLLFLPLAALCFHRFDPGRTKQIAGKSRRNWLGRIQNLFKPLSRRLVVLLLGRIRPRQSLGAAIWNDAVMTFALHPLVLGAFLGITIASCFAPLAGLLPIVFALLALVVADVATRDVRANTLTSLRALPHLREKFVWWKLGSTLLVSVAFCAAPIVRTASLGALPLAALVVGVVFVASLATSLGVLTTNSKAFIVLFLSFWYLVVNDRGANRWFDFAGFYRVADLQTIVLYASLSVAALAGAQLFYRLRLPRA